MPDVDSRESRPESYTYIGRDSHSTLRVALSILVGGLFLGAVAGPAVTGHAELPPPETRIVTAAGPIEPAEPVEVPAELTDPEPTIVASADSTEPAPVSGDDTLIGAARPTERLQSVKVRSGDTLMSLMLSAGIDRDEAHEAVAALRSVFDPKDLRAGQRVRLTLSPEDELQEMALDPSVVKRVAVRRDDGASFKAFETQKALTRQLAYAEGRIQSSLYKAAVRAGVPLPVLEEMIHIYSWDVDFQREIQPNDGFAIVYERYVDEDGDFVRHGDVLQARLTLSGQNKPLYRFEIEPGIVDYFDDNGKSAKRALMRTPIDGARLSSRFGARRHPILGYTKMHKGIDFAAPSGTPVYAAGDGVVEVRGRNGGYGNYVRIRHVGNFDTAYAHLKGFARDITRGSRVRQGQVIGYVGSTGRSTGPHLHYEILRNNRQVNPLAVKMPSGRKLTNSQMARFQAERGRIDTLVAGLRRDVRLTQR